MMLRCCGALLLLLGSSPEPAQAQYRSTDSLLSVWASPGVSDSLRYEALRSVIGALRTTAQDSALMLARTMETESMKEDLPRWTIRALILQAFILEDRLELEPALERSLRAEALAYRLGDRSLTGQALAAQAGTLALSGRTAHSIRISMRAEQHLRAAGATDQLATLRLNMAEEQMILKDWDGAWATLEDVLAASPTPRNAMAAHLGMGKVIRRRGGPPATALVHYGRALAMVEAHQLDRYRATVDVAFGNAYIAMGLLDSARFHFTQAVQQAHARGLAQVELNARVGLAECELGHGRPRAARDHLDAAAALLRGAPLGQLHKDLYRLYSAAYKALGDPERALRYEEMKDSAVTELDMLQRQRALQQWELSTRMEADSLRIAAEMKAMEERAGSVVRAERLRRSLAVGGAIMTLLVAALLWRVLRRTRREHARSEGLISEMLPEEVARELKDTGSSSMRPLEGVSVLFTDFEGFTQLSAKMDQQDLITEIGVCFNAFDELCQRHGLERIKTIGDAYMAAGGLKGGAQDAARSMVQAALDMQAFIEARHAERSTRGLQAFRMRVGIHTGPVVAGIVGVKKFQYDIWGDTVNTANRMESSGEVGKVNISEATYALVKNETGLSFSPRGKVQAKGKGDMDMFFVHRSTTGAQVNFDRQSLDQG